MYTQSQLKQLRDELDRLATSTWHKVEAGPARGLAFRPGSPPPHASRPGCAGRSRCSGGPRRAPE